MKLDLLQQKLLEAARKAPPSDAVPWAFERRVMAWVREHPAADPLLVWYAGLRRAALTACALVLVLGAVNSAIPGATADEADLSTELAATHLESALYAPAAAIADAW